MIFSGWEFVAAAVAVFGAAVVRGFAGFGFSALTVAMLTMMAKPAMVVPMVFMLEIAASLWMLPSLWRQVDFRWVALVGIGLAFGSPAGVFLLANVSADILRPIIYVVLSAVSIIALLQHSGKMARWRAPPVVAGLAAGIGNGMAAIGGVICALFLLADKERKPARIRASLAGMFLLTDIYALLWGGALGVAGAAHLQSAALLLPALFGGIIIGSRLFGRSDPQKYRAVALAVILAAAIAAMLRQLAL
ncbi:MAG: sulfite exporter TauE/SafE family protein [Gammaproteobacteria bacterium]